MPEVVPVTVRKPVSFSFDHDSKNILSHTLGASVVIIPGEPMVKEQGFVHPAVLVYPVLHESRAYTFISLTLSQHSHAHQTGAIWLSGCPASV